MEKADWFKMVNEVRKYAPKEPVWKCVREYYEVCTSAITNKLALTIFERFLELAQPMELSTGESIPYDPFPKQDWNKLDEFPVVAIEGFKVIQSELDLIILDKIRTRKRK